ncbi:MAG: hypothetical protein COT88_02030 [Candidatus Colwellbacteria bacterium CG10_big_fil_rev_8_21_14_0_10_41_28]|uniref:Zinc finger DksA/TraR C4-type domain-containing protein n=1 Tax=Candidatus Colwellbacteria bacterium CG10_big_fil_rev_8_21_14_0_10_41_28 TaxID=1974539 RepID=A0A2H0VH00_9BACT|nr:MAG: hypothetical protein COT88_02030 [Candidatus Colwellbacteria bacterium CG10_big_fil_rev_8_21_14_0_10_41_28]
MIPEDKIKELKDSLLSDKQRLEEKIETLSDMEFGDAVGTDNEDADETEEMANTQSTIDLLEERLERINDALTRIEMGVYGVCQSCHKEIGVDLLSVDPESTLCKECKAD